MKKFLDSKTPLIIIILIFALLNVIFWPIAGPRISEIQASVWVCYAFVCVGFIGVGALTLIKLKSQNNFTATLPTFFVATGYLLVSLLANIIMMAINAKDVTAAIIINAILIIVAAILLVIAIKSLSRVEGNTAKREQRVRSHRNLGIEVSALIGISGDDEVNAELKKLKEDLDYSSSASTPATAEKDVELRELTSELADMLDAGAEKEEVLKIVKKLQRTLKIRNQILMASR